MKCGILSISINQAESYHGQHISDGLKSIVQASIGHLHQYLLDWLVVVIRVNEFCHSKLLGYATKISLLFRTCSFLHLGLTVFLTPFMCIVTAFTVKFSSGFSFLGSLRDHLLCLHYGLPCVGFGVETIDPLRFLAGYRKRQLNQALSVLSLSVGFLDCVCCAVNWGRSFALCYFVCSVSW